MISMANYNPSTDTVQTASNIADLSFLAIDSSQLGDNQFARLSGSSVRSLMQQGLENGGFSSVLITGQPTIDASTSPNLRFSGDSFISLTTNSGTNTVSVALTNTPNIDASKVTTGVFNTARIPDLDAAKITSGTLASARIPSLPYQAQLSTITSPVSLNDRSIHRYSTRSKVVPGTSYTLSAEDNGVQIVFTNSAAVTVTVPTGLYWASLSASEFEGFGCAITQGGTGQVSIVGATSPSTVTIHVPDGNAKTSEQFAVVSLLPTNIQNTYTLVGGLEGAGGGGTGGGISLGDLSASAPLAYNNATGQFSLPSLTAQLVTTALAATTDAVSLNDRSIHRYSTRTKIISGTTYTLAAADNGLQLLFTSSSAVTVTVPSTLHWASLSASEFEGFGCDIVQAGTGQVTITGAASPSVVTVRVSAGTAATARQFAILSLKPTNIQNTYSLVGELSGITGGGIDLADLSATAPLSYNNSTGVFSIPAANGSTNGYLSSANWTTFNSKVGSVIAGITGASVVSNVVFLSEEDYALIGTPDPNTIYVTPGESGVGGGGGGGGIALTDLSASAPLSYNNTTGAFSINPISNADVAAGAAIAWTKVSKSGAAAGDVGAVVASTAGASLWIGSQAAYDALPAPRSATTLYAII